jgi:uncharacterized protein
MVWDLGDSQLVSRPMLKRILFLLLFSSGAIAVAFAVDPAANNNPPSDATIKQLMEVTNVHKLLDNMTAQMDGFITQTMQQATKGQNVSPKVQKNIDRGHAEMMATMKEILSWEKMEPMYTRVYQKSFTQGEVDGMIAFYKTPTGQAVLNKMPVVLQNTMAEMQQMMQPMIQRVQQMQQQVIAEMKEEKAKPDGG